jgi:hypothetical protein
MDLGEAQETRKGRIVVSIKRDRAKHIRDGEAINFRQDIRHKK